MPKRESDYYTIPAAAFVAMHCLTVAWCPPGACVPSYGFPLPVNAAVGSDGDYDFFVVAVLVDWIAYMLAAYAVRELVRVVDLGVIASVVRAGVLAVAVTLAVTHAYFLFIGVHGLEPVGSFMRVVSGQNAFEPTGLAFPLFEWWGS